MWHKEAPIDLLAYDETRQLAKQEIQIRDGRSLMLKLLCWWLLREWRYLKSWRWQEGTTWYFAFGANLDAKVLKTRHMRPMAIVPFVLKDYELRFDHPSSWQGVGYASAHAAQGRQIYGHLIQLPDCDASRMDCDELVPFFRRYVRHEHEQEGHQFYFYVSNVPTNNLLPTPRYLGMMLSGLRLNPHIPANMLSHYQNHETRLPETPTPDSEYFVQRGRWPNWLRKITGPYEIAMSRLLITRVRHWTIFGHFMKINSYYKNLGIE